MQPPGTSKFSCFAVKTTIWTKSCTQVWVFLKHTRSSIFLLQYRYKRAMYTSYSRRSSTCNHNQTLPRGSPPRVISYLHSSWCLRSLPLEAINMHSLSSNIKFCHPHLKATLTYIRGQSMNTHSSLPATTWQKGKNSNVCFLYDQVRLGWSTHWATVTET